MTGTQLNGKWEDAKVKNQNLIRGSKAIVDKIDVGTIMLPISPEEAAMVNVIADTLGLDVHPNMAFHIYKARRSKYRPPTIIWSYVDLGTCRVRDLFVTDRYFNLVEVQILNVQLEFNDELDYKKAETVLKPPAKRAIPMHEFDKEASPTSMESMSPEEFTKQMRESKKARSGQTEIKF